MKFTKDILLFDIETTGSDPDKDNILQLSAILLDKDNLLEKNRFNQYVRISFLDSTINQHASLLGISFDQLKNSKKIYDVIKDFNDAFEKNVTVGNHTIFNVIFLKNGYRKASIPFVFDHHMIDIWSLGYIYTLNYGLKKMPSLFTFFDYFNLQLNRPNDAMARLTLTCDVFRRIVKGT